MDFFTREVTIHSGDTLDFQTPPGEFHLIAVAKDGPALRQSLPLFAPDDEAAPGTGDPRILPGPGTGALMSSPTCGLELAGQPNCILNGDPIAPQIAGGIGGAHVKKLLQFITQGKKVTPATFNGTVDWNVTIKAGTGDYSYLCLIHPKMNGTIHVVGAGEATTTQGMINAQSLTQFAVDKAEGQLKYAADNTPTFTPVAGHKVWDAHAGDNTADGHVGFFEMMPRNLNLGVFDSVHWTWGPDSELHTVAFLTDSAFLPPFIGPDCGAGSDDVICPPTSPNFELVFDPGTARPGELSNPNPLDPNSLVDSGVLVGKDYVGLQDPVQDWSANAKAPGTYAYQCTIHDWMRAVVQVTGA
jgi:plastocyanin